MGNIHVKLFEIWTSGSWRSRHLKKRFRDDAQTDKDR